MKFVAFERAKQGTGASRRLRNTGKTPGIVYGGEGQPQLIELDHNALWHALKKEAFHSTILEMELGGKAGKVLLRDVQYHPYKQQVTHIDFQRVDAKTKLHMKVPFHYVKAEESQAVKFENCVVNHVMSELDISCLPADLPEFIEVDLSGMKKGMSLHLNEITLPKGVTAVTRGKPNPVIVSMVLTGGEEPADATAPAADAAAPAADAKAAPAGKGAPAAKGDAKGGDKAAPAAKAPAAKAPAKK
ncbi:50S ribosomal protein L25/general stress protein Ctc [Caenimonas aquaedulcis]|uniref:Large ribosomal subunit protein bL25 n=1 Tax=Caenimonas aquaedulcis TaxID=2793270 RepID=A0A931H6Z5_9BURK|nr:50S ribosomal protein L25/general stress protein Ctc [Caenimonas aquaedulcis]MBG9389558.1 50S ribosomal protein L25/general stress protein Ctc [Caenimonas aquaedulcis]